jgi:hypothetical protein
MPREGPAHSTSPSYPDAPHAASPDHPEPSKSRDRAPTNWYDRPDRSRYRWVLTAEPHPAIPVRAFAEARVGRQRKAGGG